jgi:hypothetical protein
MKQEESVIVVTGDVTASGAITATTITSSFLGNFQ